MTTREYHAPATARTTVSTLPPARGLVSRFSSPVKDFTGFTVNITNYDARFSYEVSSSAGTVTRGAPSGAVLPLTVSGLAPGQSVSLTVMTTREYHAPATARIAVSTLRSQTRSLDTGLVALDRSGRLPQTDLRVTVWSSPKHVLFRARISCTDYAGDLCRLLRLERDKLLVERPDVCSPVYSGPERARLRGMLWGEKVDLRISRAESCGARLWRQLEPLWDQIETQHATPGKRR